MATGTSPADDIIPTDGTRPEENPSATEETIQFEPTAASTSNNFDKMDDTDDNLATLDDNNYSEENMKDSNSGDAATDEPLTLIEKMVEAAGVVDTEEALMDAEDMVVEASSNQHQVHDEALAKSCNVLNDLKSLIHENSLFCSQGRRQEWTEEIQDQLKKSAPKTIIGVLGSTGVGKSRYVSRLVLRCFLYDESSL
jgi:flagellar biosynthesis GTPase FlhF